MALNQFYLLTYLLTYLQFVNFVGSSYVNHAFVYNTFARDAVRRACSSARDEICHVQMSMLLSYLIFFVSVKLFDLKVIYNDFFT